MSNPRFSPRRYLRNPDQFGRSAAVMWIGNLRNDAKRDQLAAAQLQHLYAVRIYWGARKECGSVKAYAEKCQVPYDRLSKVLRGEVIMRLEDIVTAERILGGIVREQSMSPPTRRMEQVEAKTRRQEF